MEQAAHQEKSHAALSSVLWSAFLTVIKLWAGIVTGSLGIISEAALRTKATPTGTKRWRIFPPWRKQPSF